MTAKLFENKAEVGNNIKMIIFKIERCLSQASIQSLLLSQLFHSVTAPESGFHSVTAPQSAFHSVS
jgi:hypothetical protein